MQSHLDISRQLLDRQVMDANNVLCGKVDDLELEGGIGTELKVTAILIGSRVASDRLPALPRYLLQKMVRRKIVRIPWAHVSVITNHIKLNTNASDFGLDESESIAFRFIGRLPGAWKK